jgi:hypothetical protein
LARLRFSGGTGIPVDAFQGDGETRMTDLPRPELRLTRDHVIDICGRLDDLKIAEIVATGATTAELMEARTWLAADDYLGASLGRQVTGRVARLVELLRADEGEWDDR